MAATYPRSAIPEPYQREIRKELRKIPTWKLQEAYGKLKAGESTGVELMERNRAYALSAIEEALWERGKLPAGGSHSSEAVGEEEWNQAYSNVIPMMGIIIGVLGVSLSWLALTRLQAQAVGSLEPPTGVAVDVPKVRYSDSQVFVEVRNPGDWYALRDFINPMDPKVQQVYHQVGSDTWALLDWVCRNITYRSDNGEWWEFPAETISRQYADCEGTSILLASLLRNFTDCHVVVGSYRGFGHAWVQTDGQILETTYTYAHDVPDPQNYRAYAMFNDQEIIELWPRALSRLFQPARNECQKLTLMAEAVNGN